MVDLEIKASLLRVSSEEIYSREGCMFEPLLASK